MRLREVLLGLRSAGLPGELLGGPVVLDWGDPGGESRALAGSAALVPAPWERLFVVRGGDRVSFLQAMLAQDLRRLAPGLCLPAAQADRTGHLVAEVWLLEAADSHLLRVRRDLAAAFFELLDRHRITEEVAWEGWGDDGRYWILTGPEAEDRFAELGPLYLEGEREGGDLSPLGVDGVWMRVRETAAPEFLLAWQPSGDERLAGLLDERWNGSVVPAGWTAFNQGRILAGRAWIGLDGGTERLVPELMPEDRVSHDKGCYLGQETLARIHYRGGLNWRVGRLRISSGQPVAPGTDLVGPAGDRAGWVSSVALPNDGEILALGFLHRRYRESPHGLRLATGATVNWLG